MKNLQKNHLYKNYKYKFSKSHKLFLIFNL
jgi:hypothetical protein